MSNTDKTALVPKLRFPEFQGSSSWQIRTLGQACHMQAGKFVPAAEIHDKYMQGLFPCYGGNGLRGYTATFTHNGKYSLIGRQGALCGNINQRYEKVQKLKNMLCQRLSEIEGVYINSGEECSPYIVNISVTGIRSEIMLHYLEERDIYVSSGSACSKGAKSGVLTEFGLNDRLADSALRISLCSENTVQELRILAENIEYAKERLLK